MEEESIYYTSHGDNLRFLVQPPLAPQVLGEPFSIYRFQSPPALGDSGGENLNP
jgi:hypothetical protein